jgi:Na+/H+ antiporter NhaD/arsenite permease-like protein
MRLTSSRWFVPAVALVIGSLIVAAELGGGSKPLQAVIGFAIVAVYAIGLLVLQSRSDVARVLSGLPPDERWESINNRALSTSAQVIAVVLVGAFVISSFQGADPMPYAWTAAVFSLAYLGSLAWYRARS